MSDKLTVVMAFSNILGVKELLKCFTLVSDLKAVKRIRKGLTNILALSIISKLKSGRVVDLPWLRRLYYFNTLYYFTEVAST